MRSLLRVRIKAKLYAQIRTLVAVKADFRNQVIPKGKMGTVVECYENPEGYAVDLAIPNEALVGGFEYENVILNPDKFAVVDTASKMLNVSN